MGDIEVSPAKFHANQRLRWQEIRNGTKEADKLTNKKINNKLYTRPYYRTAGSKQRDEGSVIAF